MSKCLGGPHAAGSQRAAQVKLGMKRINIAEMKKAYEGVYKRDSGSPLLLTFSHSSH
jgi:hypothetical protein